MNEEHTRSSKLKSTTLWLSISLVVLNPASWVADYLMRKGLIDYMIDNGITDPSIIQNLIIELPLTTIATATLTAVTAYIGGNKARNVSQNMQKK